MDKGLLLVTGATGLVGSNFCLAALGAGYRVRALVRSFEETEPLRAVGVELVRGDVTDADSLVKAATGVRRIVHSAALISGTWSTASDEDFWAVNYLGVLNVLAAAKQADVRRTVLYSTVGILDWSYTSTNVSPIVPITSADSAYISAKRAAFYASMERASLGQDIVTVLPAMIYGPAPMVERALVPTSCNGILVLGLRGELDQYVPMPLSWSYVHDVVAAGMSALETGPSGERYLASGRSEDVCTLPQFCNRANVIAAIAHRVKDIDLAAGGDEIGSMRAFAERKAAEPLVDPSQTEAALGISTTPLDTGLRTTVQWLREMGKF